MNHKVLLKLEDFFNKYPLLTFHKDEVIIHPEEDIKNIYFIKKGNVRMHAVSEDGDEAILNIFRPTSFFPIMISLNNFPNKYYFVAMGEVEVLKAPVDETIKFIEKESDVALDLVYRFSAAIVGLLTRIQNVATEESYSKISNLLLYLADKFGQKNGKKIVINIPMSHSDIAKWVGVRRETVSRQIEKMQKEGLIKIDKKIITINNLEKLKNKKM